MATTPLESEIRRRIALAGPMPVRQYMALCLTHPEHGYYVTRDPFGRSGDFVTSPEVSQVFGELLGLWAAAVWRMMGAPENVRLVELGPGRGTLMVDALRAAQVVPAFRDAVVLHMVEISPVLRRLQQEALATIEVPAMWHDSFGDLPDGPIILLANEFVDALPIHQAVKQDDGWHERVVVIGSDDKLAFGAADAPLPMFEQIVPPAVRGAPAGTVFEWRPDALPLSLGRRIAQQGGAALIIDYGHLESAAVDTLQAVGGHAFADALASPGEVDLTAHVDFPAFGHAAESMGARIQGPVDQATFLRNLGIDKRATALKAFAPLEKRKAVDAAVNRLLGEERTGMGKLFKVVAIAHPSLGKLPGFQPETL